MEKLCLLLRLGAKEKCKRRSQRGQDGKTAYEKGKRFNKELVPFGECVHRKPLSTEKKKTISGLDPQWKDGIWLGIRDESNEVYVGTKNGVVIARSIMRKPGPDKWDKKQLDEMQGLPWEPIPGKGERQALPMAIEIWPERDVRVPPAVVVTGGPTPRETYIGKRQLGKHGFTPGCAGCKAARKGARPVAHSSHCRKRIYEEMA